MTFPALQLDIHGTSKEASFYFYYTHTHDEKNNQNFMKTNLEVSWMNLIRFSYDTMARGKIAR